ncbi:hypothetical protein ZEAMMB73_Zm00001d053263 [Zea mays]|uniref:Uncharacterized protein n=1 Tax=Zea mays TaxID=4577 RepID=A0A1D6QNI1_MAIZE|nr:hypothetical protein ZEAMMB73_Zm00001d053263 [Zea mays]
MVAAFAWAAWLKEYHEKVLVEIYRFVHVEGLDLSFLNEGLLKNRRGFKLFYSIIFGGTTIHVSMTLNILADLSPLFTWDTKQVFVFVAAECETPHDAFIQKTDICEGKVPWAPHPKFCQALLHHEG